MRTKLLNILDNIRSSFWFLPALMVAVAMLMAWITVSLDERYGRLEFRGIGWLYSGAAEGARTLLATIAGSMITVASVTFSITIVALTLTSSQFGPRLLRNFMRDTGNQLTLGTFIATFVYCLLILRTIRGNPEDFFVPHLSVSLSLALTLTSLGVLIYFIHHIALAIQANSVVAAVSRELDQAIERIFPHKMTEVTKDESLDDEPSIDFESAGVSVSARQSGYLTAIDQAGLLALATKADAIFRLDCRAGQFVAQGNSLLTVSCEGGIDKELADDITVGFVLSGQGNPLQDVEFAIHQLVEVAVRALSPGINDPYTAIACVDRLAVALSQIAGREMPSAMHYDAAGKLRMIVRRPRFPGIVDAAFNQTRQYGRSSVAVTIRLLEAIAIIAAHVRDEEDRRSLREHAIMIERGSQAMDFDDRDQKDIAARYQTVMRLLET